MVKRIIDILFSRADKSIFGKNTITIHILILIMTQGGIMAHGEVILTVGGDSGFITTIIIIIISFLPVMHAKDNNEDKEKIG